MLLLIVYYLANQMAMKVYHFVASSGDPAFALTGFLLILISFKTSSFSHHMTHSSLMLSLATRLPYHMAVGDVAQRARQWLRIALFDRLRLVYRYCRQTTRFSFFPYVKKR
jgi:hypothetical protein